MTMTKPKYLSARKLGILPIEHEALIAFITAPASGRKVKVIGTWHWYEQWYAGDPAVAKIYHCGTSGCIAGYVRAYAAAKGIQIRHAKSSIKYIDSIMSASLQFSLKQLYCETRDYPLPTARRVVDHMLRTGEVKWP